MKEKTKRGDEREREENQMRRERRRRQREQREREAMLKERRSERNRLGGDAGVDETKERKKRT